jgi:fumarylpyruvate hydrolase
MVTGYVIPPSARASISVSIGAQRFPVRRVFGVGRNYGARARKMGNRRHSLPPHSPRSSIARSKWWWH